MNFAPLTTAALAAVLTLAGPARAADEHHPEASGPAAQAPAPPPSEARGEPMMGPRGMMGMMGPEGMAGMMRMMQMMGMMGERGPGAMSADREMTGMRMRAMTEHVEGRIAFLRAELKIKDAQAAAWNRFADALRANAKSLREAQPPMARHGGQDATLAQSLDQEERFLGARLEGLRGVKGALAPLYAGLDDEQKKLAERLIPPHLGLMRMGAM
jgi:hypothetical protein